MFSKYLFLSKLNKTASKMSIMFQRLPVARLEKKLAWPPFEYLATRIELSFGGMLEYILCKSLDGTTASIDKYE